MKRFRKWIVFLTVVFFAVSVLNGPAIATKKLSGRNVKNDNIQTMVSGKWYTVKDIQTPTYCFKLSKDSLVTINWIISDDNYMDSHWGIYADENLNKRAVEFSTEGNEKGNISFAVKKGTYYIYIRGNGAGFYSGDYKGKT